MKSHKCLLHNHLKTLRGHYKTKTGIFEFRACPKCYPSTVNVVNALDRLVADITFNKLAEEL
jgi:hypothetical protein